PPPRTRWGTASSARSFSVRRSSSAVRGKAITAAGPPTPIDVWREKGSCSRNGTPSSASACVTFGSMALTALSLRRPLVHAAPVPCAARSLRAGPRSRPPLEQLVPRMPDAARAQGQHHVAFLDLEGELLPGGRQVAGVGPLPVPAFADGPRQGLRRHARQRLLAGGVDVGEQQDVRLMEGAAEVVPQMLRARIAVGLEQDQGAPGSGPGAQRLEGRADPGRLMAVVVDDRDALGFAPHLETTIDPAERLEAGLDALEGHLEV